MAGISPTRLFLIFLAGGQGTRAASDSTEPPKQFRSIGNRQLFQFSLVEFLKLSDSDFPVAGLVLAVPDTWREKVSQTLREMNLPIPWQLASAGKSRTQSTWSALQVLESDKFAPADKELVAIHDAARPFATAGLLESLAQAAKISGSAVPGIPVPDTIVRVPLADDVATSAEYLARESLVAVQTPQVFCWDILQQAHRWADEQQMDFTDDGGLLARRGTIPSVVQGETENWKVTTGGDWLRAKDRLTRAAGS